MKNDPQKFSYFYEVEIDAPNRDRTQTELRDELVVYYFLLFYAILKLRKLVRVSVLLGT